MRHLDKQLAEIISRNDPFQAAHGQRLAQTARAIKARKSS